MAKTRNNRASTNSKPTVKRTIIFHDIEIVEDPLYQEHEFFYDTKDFTQTLIKALINHLTEPIDKRFMINGTKKLAFTDLSFEPTSKNVNGILILFKDDVNPEILNTSSGNIRSVDIDNDEGIIEKTHFILHFTKRNDIVSAIEYNHSGPRVSDLAYCLGLIYNQQCLATSVKAIPIVKEGLVEKVKNLGNITTMKFKVFNDYKYKLKHSIKGLFSVLNQSEEFFKNQIIELVVRYDVKHYKQPTEVKDIVNRLVSFLKKDKENYDVFDQLVISGDNLENNGKKNEKFDLLDFRLQFEIKVEIDTKHNRIISNNIFMQIIKLINTEFYGTHT